MHIWFDGDFLHIETDNELNAHGNSLEINHKIYSDCDPCDRCHSRQDGHAKILPFRAETLCDDCIRKLELLDYIITEK